MCLLQNSSGLTIDTPNRRTAATLLYFIPKESAVKQQDYPAEYSASRAGLRDSLSRARISGDKVPRVVVFWRQ